MEPDNDRGITNKLITEILDGVKLILNITDTSKDELFTLYIKILCTNILIKTNRRIFVPDLKYLVIDLVVNKFNTDTPDEEIQSIVSMTEYDRTVNFGVSNVLQTKLTLLAQKQLQENDILINKYKLLYRT